MKLSPTPSEQGTTLLELLVGTLLFSILFLAVTSTFLDTTRKSHNNTIVMNTEDEVHTVLDFLSADLRMAGAGMPLGQGSFRSELALLGDAPLPILTSATSTFIQVRSNEAGWDTVLMTDFTPSPSQLSFSVLDAADLDVGDTIYLSDMTRGGAQGMRATVTGITGNTISIGSGYIASAAASFSAGSTINRVTDVTFNSPLDGSGITRDTGSGALLVAPNSSFTITYLDGAGVSLAPPLTPAVISSQLASLRLSVSVTSRQPLKNGTTYTATAERRIALRNMNLNR